MGAKSKTPTKNAKKAAVELKSPKTPKADKVATKTKKLGTKEEKQDRCKIGLDPALVQKATEALIQYHEKTALESKSLLGNDQPIHVQFTLLRTPVKPSPKPIRVMIPHPLFHLKQSSSDGENTLEEPEVCLIVKEESKPWCQEMIERFPDHMGCIKKVLGLQSLRTKHARYEQQRALLHKYNFFLADDRILPMLSKALGKHFYNAKKLPIPINLSRKEALPIAIQNALSATYMSMSTGTCIMIRAGSTAMTPIQLTENIVQIAAGAVPKMPQKWVNVQNIAIKTPNSVALPIYNKTPEVLREIAALAGIVQTIDEVEQESKEEGMETTTTTPNSKTANKKDLKIAEKKRETQSPLLRALKKQKQGEKEKSNQSSENVTKTKATKKGNQQEKKRTSPSEDPSEKVDDTQHSAKKSKKVTDKKESVDEIETPKSTKHADNSNSKKSNKDMKSPNSTTKSTPVVKSEITKSPKATNVNETKKTNKGMEPTKSKKETVSPQASKESSDKNVKKEEGVVNSNFIAAKKFQGSKKGYVFKMGKEGLGYYVDVKPVVDHMAMDALTRAVKNKGNQGGLKKGKKQGKRRF